jgi:hypothetical protein
MRQLTIETATLRIATFAAGERLLNLTVLCFGPAAACDTARLVPRRHETAPEDGLWDFDLVCGPGTDPAGAPSWRNLAFTGEAGWCEGVRLHSPGGVLEHRLPRRDWIGPAPSAPGLTGSSASRVQPLRSAAVRRRPEPLRVFLDAAAGALLALGLSILPFAAAAGVGAPKAASVASR